MPSLRTRKDPVRFWKKVNRTNDIENCWLWTAGKNEKGYGSIGWGEGIKAAHRVSWEINCGEIPKGMHVLHKCDNPSCVNPHHLFLGTNADNVADKVRKGRTCDNHGERNPNLKLTDRQVSEIRQRYANGETNQSALGREYGISQTHIGRIIYFKNRV